MDLPLVIRIAFRSGAVAEEVGSEQQVVELFETDDQGLIDHVLTLDPLTGSNDLWQHEDDDRWAEEVQF